MEHPTRHAQDLVPYDSFVVLSVPSFCFLLKRAFKITFLEDRVAEYADLLNTLKFLMLPTRCLHKELEYCLKNTRKRPLWIGARTGGRHNPCSSICSFCLVEYEFVVVKRIEVIDVLEIDIFRSG